MDDAKRTLLRELQLACEAGDGAQTVAKAAEYRSFTQRVGKGARAKAAEYTVAEAEANALYARALFTQHRFAEALTAMQEAAELDKKWQKEVDEWEEFLMNVRPPLELLI